MNEVVIAGGGPAGCALALALARRGIRATVLERSNGLTVQGDGSAVRPGEMLQPAAGPLLAQLGIDLSGHLRSHGVSSAWESDALQQNDFLFGVHGQGWLLDRRRFDATLAAAAQDLGATIVTGRRARAEDFGGALVVDATGQTAVVARERGARRIVFDQLAGVFAFPDAPGGGDTFTLVEAVEHGWWYSALVPGGRIAVALMSDGDIIRAEGLADPRRWQDALAQTRYTRERAGTAGLREPLQVRSAASSILEPVAGDGWLAAGDAASAWDPLSAAGLYKALHNAVAAAEAIATGAFDLYAQSVRASFDEYLDTRDRYYARVQRWPESLFWQRRQRGITLDPRAVLRTHDPSPAALARIDPRLRIAGIAELCREPRRAHEVVAAYAPRHGDATVILALQAMLREGVLAS